MIYPPCRYCGCTDEVTCATDRARGVEPDPDICSTCAVLRDSRLRPDGWPLPEHIDCIQEIEYLRERLEVAEAVIRAARLRDEIAVVFAIDGYGTFLGNSPDRWRNDIDEGNVWPEEVA